MDLDTFMAIIGVIWFVGGCILERYLKKNVFLTYKDQKVGGK